MTAQILRVDNSPCTIDSERSAKVYSNYDTCLEKFLNKAWRLRDFKISPDRGQDMPSLNFKVKG